MDRKIRFLQPAKHTDDEITAFLQTEAEKGWWLKKVRGNYFTFVKKPYEGKRICARTYFTASAEIPTETQLRKELPHLRRGGWDMIAVGGPENIADTRRHAFLYEEKPDKDSPIDLPEVDGDQQLLAAKRGRRKAFSGLLLCLLYVLFWGFAVFSDWMGIACDNFYLFSSIAFSLLLLISIVISASAFVSTVKKDREEEIRSGRYRLIDRATGMVFATLVILCLFLAFDYFYANAGRSPQKLRLNGTVIEVFSDEVPISLETLGLSIDNPYRSTRYTRKESLLASSLYGFDEAFGSEEEGVDYVSYTLFSSPFSFLRRFASSRLLPRGAKERPETAALLSAGKVFASPEGKRLLIIDGENLLSVKAGFVLSDDQIIIMASLL